MNGLMLRLKSYVRKKMTLPDLFEDRVRQNPQKTFLVFGDEIYTYEAFNRKCNRVAHAARSIGLAKGSVVAMFMYNEPACVWTFIGQSAIPSRTHARARTHTRVHDVRRVPICTDAI